MINFRITPAQFLRELGWKFTQRGGVWLSLKICPFCDGGVSCDTYTFAMHATDGNFFCQRSKCGMRGSFWKLIESQGKNPRDYVAEHSFNRVGFKKKKYMYGRSEA